MLADSSAVNTIKKAAYSIEKVATLAIEREFVEPTHTVEKVGKMFFAHSHLQSLPVVHKEIPVGIVHRYQLMDIFLSTYGRDLHGRKPIMRFMDPNPLVVEDTQPLEAASQYITQNLQSQTIQDFIITHEGRYRGVGTVMELLRRITDLQIQEYNYTLAEKVKELEHRSSELAIANTKAEIASQQAIAANHAKSRFLANMSHELRTPINAILGYSEMLCEDFEDDETLQDYLPDLNKIQDSSRHLLGIISDILDITKIESGKVDINITEFFFTDLLKEAVDTMKSLAEKQQNQIKTECNYERKLCTDRAKVRQCLFNILNNAVKFSENSEVRIFAYEEDEPEQSWLVFGVEDHGIGIAPEKLETLFDAFCQADNSSTRRFDGAGLGLAITKQFCEAMGGTIDVTSVVEEGSTFTVRLPTNYCCE